MEVNHYKCKYCVQTMHSKARYGSRQFEGNWNVQVFESILLGKIVDDPGRPAATADNLLGWERSEDDSRTNFCAMTDYHGKFDPTKRRWFELQIEPCKDLMIRISMGNQTKPDEYKEEALDRLQTLAKALSFTFNIEKNGSPGVMVNAAGLTEEEVGMLKCYLTGGHKWELQYQVDNAGNLTIDNREKEA